MPYQKQPWEETFRKFYNDNENGGSSRWLVAPNIVEVFIRQLLLSQLQEVWERVEKIKNEKPPMKLRRKSDRVDWLNDGYQLALSDILQTLSTMEKERKRGTPNNE